MKNPEAIRDDATHDGLPLHFAMKYDSRYDVIKFLLAKYSDGARKRNLVGMLPLHMAAFHHVPFSKSLLLLRVFPEAAKIKDCTGQLAWFISLEKGNSSEMIQLFCGDTIDHNALLRVALQNSRTSICTLRWLLLTSVIVDKQNFVDGKNPLQLALQNAYFSCEHLCAIISRFPEFVDGISNGVNFVPIGWSVTQQSDHVHCFEKQGHEFIMGEGGMKLLAVSDFKTTFDVAWDLPFVTSIAFIGFSNCNAIHGWKRDIVKMNMLVCISISN